MDKRYYAQFRTYAEQEADNLLERHLEGRCGDADECPHCREEWEQRVKETAEKARVKLEALAEFFKAKI